MWVAYQGRFKLEWNAKAASQVLSEGALIDRTSGYFTVCSSTTTKHAGVFMGPTITSGSANYALTSRIPVQVPCDAGSKFKVSVYSSDTLLATDIGTVADQAGSPVGIDITRASSSYDCLEITDYLGANLCAGKLVSYEAFRTA